MTVRAHKMFEICAAGAKALSASEVQAVVQHLGKALSATSMDRCAHALGCLDELHEKQFLDVLNVSAFVPKMTKEKKLHEMMMV